MPPVENTTETDENNGGDNEDGEIGAGDGSIDLPSAPL